MDPLLDVLRFIFFCIGLSVSRKPVNIKSNLEAASRDLTSPIQVRVRVRVRGGLPGPHLASPIRHELPT